MRKLLLTFCALVLQPLLRRLPCPELPKGGLAQQPTRFIEIPADALEDKSRAACSPKSSATSTACHTNSNTSTSRATSNTPALAPKGRLYRRRYRHRVGLPPRYFPRAVTTCFRTPTSRRSGTTHHRRIFAREPLRPRPDGPRHRAAWTGNVGLNPWSDFNISGQFVCESFGLISPAMPQTAAKDRPSLHARRDRRRNRLQATQLFTTMIATAFVETDATRSSMPARLQSTQK